MVDYEDQIKMLLFNVSGDKRVRPVENLDYSFVSGASNLHRHLRVEIGASNRLEKRSISTHWQALFSVI